MGLRWRWICDGTDRIDWRDLFVIIRHADPDSPLIGVAHPDQAGWNLNTMLLATMVDTLRVANWQRSGDEDAPYPKPLPRPGTNTSTRNNPNNPDHEDTDELEIFTDALPGDDESGHIKGEETPVDDLNTWLGWE